MALTTRTNGSTSGNIIQASWFNDFKDLLTGVMTTQPVTIANPVTISGLLTASAGITASYGIISGNLSVTGATSCSSGLTIPNTQIINLTSNTGISAYLYCNSSNDFILHAGNSNRVSITNNTGTAQLIVDMGAPLITAVPKLQANGGVGFVTGTINRYVYFGGNGAGTFNHGLGAAPIDVEIHLNTSTMATYSVYGYTSSQCSVNVSVGGVGWGATAWD